MIRAVLFDLDGTLLDIDLDRFLRSYFAALGPTLASVSGQDAHVALGALMSATNSMCEEHPGRTNRDVFNDRFAELTGADLAQTEAASVIGRFYSEQFPGLQHDHGPRIGGVEAVAAARTRGLRTALATNPIFPIEAIRERMRWAGLEETWFDHVTSYETMHACKPHASFFVETADAIGVSPGECLMVGDDPVLDMSASQAGMETFYVGPEPEAIPEHRSGSLADLAATLDSLAD